MTARKGRIGMPAYEWGVIIMLAAIVLAVLGDRIERLLELSERASVELTVMNIRSGLRLEKARRIALGQSMRDLAGSNPLRYLDSPVQADSDKKMLNLLEVANLFDWRKETTQSVMVYRPSRRRYLKLQEDSAVTELRWQIRASLPDGSDADLVPVIPYAWF